MTTPSKDIFKYNTTDKTSAVSPAYAAGLFWCTDGGIALAIKNISDMRETA